MTRMPDKTKIETSVPPSAAEAAAAAAHWERRGLLGRLVRLDGEAITERLPVP